MNACILQWVQTRNPIILRKQCNHLIIIGHDRNEVLKILIELELCLNYSIKHLLYKRLSESGWCDQVRMMVRLKLRANDDLTLDELIDSTLPKARGKRRNFFARSSKLIECVTIIQDSTLGWKIWGVFHLRLSVNILLKFYFFFYL